MTTTLAAITFAVVDGASVGIALIAVSFAVHAIRLACGCPNSEIECIAAAWSVIRRWAASRAHSQRTEMTPRDQAPQER